MAQPSDIDIARSVPMRPIDDVAKKVGLGPDDLYRYGPHKAKIPLERLPKREKKAKLILVTATSPTPAGEGKTTTSVGLCDGLNKLGKPTVVCLREPSLGPVFGMKGGAAGGGYAQVNPMADINLHFTGDFSAIALAHNLLSALIDNHIHQGNVLGIDPSRVTWKRVVDMNDRALRDVAVGLGGPVNGQARETGFDIVVASEIMAIFCLTTGLEDLQRRLGQIVIGQTFDKQPVTAADLKANGAMAALLRDAVSPNLVQTLEGNPAIIHGGPFANIAHGCNSVLATNAGMAVADYVVTEAGFGADLGAEKFMDIKCRAAGLAPDVVVLVTTVRSLKYQGGVPKGELTNENVPALKDGLVNLERHLDNLKNVFGVPVVVSINRFSADTEDELKVVKQRVEELGGKCAVATHWSDGGAGAVETAERVLEVVDGSNGSNFKYAYDLDLPLLEKIETIAKRIYRAEGVTAAPKVVKQLKTWEDQGYGNFPVCVAKTQYSFSTDANALGAPSDHKLHVREVRLAAGAGFIVAVCGDVMTMPGLPREPAANRIGLDEDGNIVGLF